MLQKPDLIINSNRTVIFFSDYKSKKTFNEVIIRVYFFAPSDFLFFIAINKNLIPKAKKIATLIYFFIAKLNISTPTNIKAINNKKQKPILS